MALKRFAAGAITLAFAATSLAACSSDDNAAGTDAEVITIGTTDATTKMWSVFQDKAEEQGYNVEVVPFSDYQTPNRALDEGSLVMNQFQHLKFLAEYNVGSNSDLTPIGSTQIVPLALYSTQVDSVDDIEDGAEVAIPNDPSNQGRAINVLAAADLIQLKQEGLVTPTPADIDEGASKVRVVPVDAAQTTVAYNEGKLAIINNSFLDRAGIDPTSAIYQDDPASPEAEPFINVFVVKADRADDQRLKDLAAIYHDPEVLEAAREDSKGTAVPVERSEEDLKEILERTEAEVRNS